MRLKKDSSLPRRTDSFPFLSMPRPAGKIGDAVEIPGANGAAFAAIEILSDGRDEWGSDLEPYPDWRNTDREN